MFLFGTLHYRQGPNPRALLCRSGFLSPVTRYYSKNGDGIEVLSKGRRGRAAPGARSRGRARTSVTPRHLRPVDILRFLIILTVNVHVWRAQQKAEGLGRAADRRRGSHQLRLTQSRKRSRTRSRTAPRTWPRVGLATACGLTASVGGRVWPLGRPLL